MDKGFKDPIKSNPKPKNKPVDGKDSPWDFTCPDYDQRSSCYINAGTKQGVGHRQPVGHAGNPSQKNDMLPIGRMQTVKIYEEA